MGKLKEISSFKRRELSYELGKEGPNNYGILFKGQKKFWKVVKSKKLADRMVATLKRRGKDADVLQTAARTTEEAVYPHKMYDPKTGKAYIAKTPEDHKRMTKLGYTHDDPNTPEKEEAVKVRKNKTGMMGSKTRVHTDKKKELSKTAARKKVSIDEKDIEEGVDDPAIFKAIFLAGGPGSGKSFTVGKTGLGALGFRIVNSDDVFEFALKKAGLEATPKDIFSPKGQEIRGGAKKLTAKKMDLYLDGRLGLVIDGTGKNFPKIKKQSDALKKLGYDVGMIFVNTNLETAISRDAKRKRTLGDKQVTKMWQEVQDNIGKFQNLFGANFTIVDNSEGANWQKATLGAYKKVSKFAKSPIKSPIAKKWIKDAGGRLKDSFSVDMQRKLAMVECVLGNSGNIVQIAESITLQSKPSEIKEISKKLYGKND